MNTRRLASFVLGVLLLAAGTSATATGCSAKLASSSSPTSQIVGTSGGTVTSADGNARVIIPAGALSSDVTITIAANAGASSPADATAVGTAYTFGPEGTTFAKEITVGLAFDLTKLPAGTHSSDVRLFEGQGSDYAPLATTLDSDGLHVNAFATRLSTLVPAVRTGDAGPGPVDTSTCVVTCDLDQNIDSGLGCDCGVLCNGVRYDLQCVCGQCTCYQDGKATGVTASITTAQCSTSGGAQGPIGTYFNVCNFPGSKNMGGSSGSTGLTDAGTYSCQ
jgi:hypothetical protein